MIAYCPEQALAEHYHSSVTAGEVSLLTRAFFLTPARVQQAISVTAARARPGTAALSAFCRRDSDQLSFDDLFPAMAGELQAAEAAGPGSAADYYDMVRGGLPGPASKAWRSFIMGTAASRFISEEMRTLVGDSEARGEARGEAKALLKVLAARGVAVPEETRDQFLACTDSAQLAVWLDRSVTADTISDVTGPPRAARRWHSLRRPRQ